MDNDNDNKKSYLSRLPSLANKQPIDADAIREHAEALLADVEAEILSSQDILDMAFCNLPDAIDCLLRNMDCGQADVEVRAATVFMKYGMAYAATSASDFGDDLIESDTDN
jgi:hypothetical protein